MVLIDVLFGLALIAGLALAFSQGANDMGNSMATSVGARALSMRQAAALASVLALVGALLLGLQVAVTVGIGIVDVSALSPQDAAFGMVAVLLSAFVFVLAATLLAVPVSTIHALVGAMAGLGYAVGGLDAINWHVVGGVALAWVLAPLVALLGTWILSRVLLGLLVRPARKDPFEPVAGSGEICRALVIAPLCAALLAGLLAAALAFASPLAGVIAAKDWERILFVAAVAALAFVGARVLAAGLADKLAALGEQEAARREHGFSEATFKPLTIVSSGYLALAHGASEVAAALAPVAVVVALWHGAGTHATTELPAWLIVIGALAGAAGIYLMGHRVTRALGCQLTSLDNTRGFSANVCAATTMLVCAVFGVPATSSYVATGAISGAGMAVPARPGTRRLDAWYLVRIVLCWVVTLPVAAALCAWLFSVLRWMLT